MIREQVDIDVLGLEWDAENEAHVAEHGLAVEDVVAVFQNNPMFFRNLLNRGGTHVMIGYDQRNRSLYISIVETMTEGVWRVVTGWQSRVARRLLRD